MKIKYCVGEPVLNAGRVFYPVYRVCYFEPKWWQPTISASRELIDYFETKEDAEKKCVELDKKQWEYLIY